MKTKLQTSSPTKLQVFQCPSSQTTTSEAITWLPKRRPSLLLRRTGERFSPGRQRPSRKHPNKTPPRRATTPEDAIVVDTDTIVGKAFAWSFVKCRPDDEGKDEPQHRQQPSETRGRALRLPSTKPTTNDTRVATPFPTRHRTDTGWKGPDPRQGTPKDGSLPNQLSTPTDTALHNGKPPLHLGHDIGPHTSTSSAEVTNRHRPSPNSHHGRSRETKPLPFEQGWLLYVAPSNSCSWDSSCISFL
jgi:hypothetical protein